MAFEEKPDPGGFLCAGPQTAFGLSEGLWYGFCAAPQTAPSAGVVASASASFDASPALVARFYVADQGRGGAGAQWEGGLFV